MSERHITPESERRFWLKASAVIGVLATAFAMNKLWANVSSFNEGEERGANYVCLTGEAHGHSEPDVQSKTGDGVEPYDHNLDLDPLTRICYPTENGTVRVSEDTHNKANGEWVRIDFNEVETAVKNDRVLDGRTGAPADESAAQKLAEFARNWPTDILGQQHTWVNVYKARTTSARPGEK